MSHLATSCPFSSCGAFKHASLKFKTSVAWLRRLHVDDWRLQFDLLSRPPDAWNGVPAHKAEQQYPEKVRKTVLLPNMRGMLGRASTVSGKCGHLKGVHQRGDHAVSSSMQQEQQMRRHTTMQSNRVCVRQSSMLLVETTVWEPLSSATLSRSSVWSAVRRFGVCTSFRMSKNLMSKRPWIK